jgi:hypothetical protein
MIEWPAAIDLVAISTRPRHAGAIQDGMRIIWLVVLAACSSRSERSYGLDDLPVTAWTAGLPVTGDGKLVVALSPAEPTDWSVVTGHVTFTCDGCTLGDDRAQLQIEFWDSKGVDFGHLTFDTVRARADFAGGRVRVTAEWRSPELELDAVVHGELAPAAADTRLDGCVRFRPTDALRQRDVKLHALVSITGAPADDAGRFFITLDGTLGEMRRLGKICELR